MKTKLVTECQITSQEFLSSLAGYDEVAIRKWMSPQQIIELHTEADLVLCYQGKSDQLGARLIREPNLYEQLKLKEQIKRIKSYLNQSQKRIDQLCQIAIRQEKELSE